MLRIKIEMCPRGDERPEAVREIGRMYIANVGGSAFRGDYEGAVCRRGATSVPAPINPVGPKATRTCAVTGYPRLSYNVWRLITRALLSAFPEEARGPAAVEAIRAQADAEAVSTREALESALRLVDGGAPASVVAGILTDVLDATRFGREP